MKNFIARGTTIDRLRSNLCLFSMGLLRRDKSLLAMPGTWIRFLYIAIFLLLPFKSLSAQSYTISGYVIDKESGETMIGVNIVVKDHGKGGASDGNGFFRITDLSAGKYIFEFSYIGYKTKEVEINLAQKSLLLGEIALQPEAIKAEEILVTAKSSQIADRAIEPGHLEITPQAIKSIPSARSDVFRAIKYLPGITGVDPFSPLYSTRGSDPGENLVLLDGVTIYNPYHFVSGAGIFNLYAIKNVEMMVGGFGAEYGGRNSSVLYLTTREGNNKELHGELSTTTSLTKIIMDFPIAKNATMMVSGRAFYNLVGRFLFNMPLYFYDGNISINWKINPYNRLSLRYFVSHDYMDYSFARISSYYAYTLDTDIFDDYDVQYKNNWNNQALTAILKTVITPRMYLKTQVSGSFFAAKNLSLLDFNYTDKESGEKSKLFYKTDIRNKIEDLSLKSVLSIKLNSANNFKLGAEYNHYFFKNNLAISNIRQVAAARKPAIMAAFTEDKITLGPFAIRPGLRFSKYSFSTNWRYEPRVNAALQLPYQLRVKAAWGKYYQYIISINSQEYEMSQFLDNYYPLQNDKPSASTHYIVGLEKTLFEKSSLSLNFYYKDISRVYTYDSNLPVTETVAFTDKLRSGSGQSYGMELLWKGTWKKFSGWISYGLSKSTRSYPHIMGGKTFYYDYDRTHSFKAVINHQILPALSYSGTLLIQSGIPKTLEKSVRSYFYYDPLSGDHSGFAAYVSDTKNNARLPLSIRLDLGIRKKIRKGFGAELARFIGAKDSYLNVTLGNLLFLYRNVWFYIPMGEKKYYGLGSNYFPEFSAGYTIKF